MVFCRRKSDKLEAFRVGYHIIPEWLKTELETSFYKDKHIKINHELKGKAEIIIKYPTFMAKSGDWIVKNTNGQLTAYKHKEFIKLYEVIYDDK
ncbi:hypothetical protein [Fusobacterium varium]|uniref:hypothetical protein n=1 Tax=Fusobacterium varium TaxID=856 RepID=UPI0022E28F72|nr:hypothetical protein [Fusobacterium varium]